MLLKAHRMGFSYIQVPVHHYPRRAGMPTGNNLGVIIKAVRETFVLLKLTWKERVRTSSMVRFGFTLASSYTGK
jgi:hypothetical protein